MRKSLVTSALINGAAAWYGTGHLLVARIAHDILEKESPQTITDVEAALAVLKKSDPKFTAHEDKHPMVECATFADDIKAKGGAYQSGWHFIDQPYLDEGGSIDDYDFKFDDHNITEAMSGLTNWFNHKKGYESSYEYQQVMDHRWHSTEETDGLSTALRLMIHYVGDIHQPLHATSRVNKEYPQGDRGGNSFPLPKKDGANELHAVWDSVSYEWTGYPKLPFSDADWNQYGEWAARLVSEYPVSDDVAQNMDVVSWADESFKISEDFVYAGIKEGEALPDEYVSKCRTTAERQITIGGHRLANFLKSLDFSAFKSEEQNDDKKKSVM